MNTQRGRMPGEIYAGKWDFDGGCAPQRGTTGAGSMETFTLGCFQWEKKSRGSGLKRGRIVYRIKGNARIVENVNDAHDHAEAFCRKKNEETA